MNLTATNTISNVWDSINGMNPCRFFDLGRKASSRKHVSLHIEITSKRVYQKKLDLTESGTPAPQFLSGQLLVKVSQPTKIDGISVSFMGMKNETVLGSSTFKERTKMRFKKIIIDEKFIWKDQFDMETPVGVYSYPFNFMVNPQLPETMNTYYMKVAYKIQASLITSGPDFKSQKVTKDEPVFLIRSLPETYTLHLTPIIASGNWRDLLIYVFNIQSKVAFEGQPFTASVFVYPIEQSTESFKIYSISTILIQRLEFDVLDSDNVTRRHSEVQKVALYKKFPKEGDLVMKNGCYHFETTTTFPSSETFYKSVTPQNGRNSFCKFIHPSTNNECKKGFSSNHIFKICFEVSETKNAISRNCKAQENRNSQPITGIRKSSSDNNSAPSYAAYHKRKTDANRYKRVELSFSSPIELLSNDSYDTDSLPLYSSFSKGQKGDKNKIENVDTRKVYPPDYDSLTSL